MSTQIADYSQAPLSSGQLTWVLSRHLVSFLMPFSALAFIWTGPHPWYIAPLFMLPSLYMMGLDSNGAVERRQPAPDTPAWPFDLLVYSLAALHFLIIFELVSMFSSQEFFSVDTVMVVVVIGGNSGFSIITAHELIHRKRPADQLLGRLLLCTVLQEHFYTEHLRGHHPRVGTPEDPATAKFGENFEDFYRRTIPGQFRSAWKLETRRLGDSEMSLFDVRMLHNRILHGIAVGWGLAFAILAGFGVVSFIVFLIQALMASRLLEAVNYFEHWGLRRTTRAVQPTDSWDTHSWFTYYGLTGLSRHSDHHREQSRPYQELQVFDESPILPSGYLQMVDMVMVRNDEFQKQAVRELQDRNLGPFRPETDPEDAARAEEIAAEILNREATTNTERGTRKNPREGLALFAKLLASVLVLTMCIQLESPGSMSFAARLLLNGWMMAAFVVMFRVHSKLALLGKSESTSWTVAMAVLAAIGLVTTFVTGPLA
jgi:alkane 1-monooxygenase